ncbi:MAG: aspartate/glutamate racemase family protein [Aestuariivirgaceae bacterium]
MLNEQTQAAVGILMLNTRFPRIPGDIGNVLTWPFPVYFKVVEDASPAQVVHKKGAGLLEPFITAAHELVAEGADGITTSCGFLALFQDELAKVLPVPVITSSLMQVDLVNRLLPRGKRAGVLTILASALTADHLAKAGVPAGTPLGSTAPDSEFNRAILGNLPEMDIETARADNIDAALALQKAHPDLGAIVLECTNMVPYAADMAAATGLPVYSIETFVTWFQSGLSPRRFEAG